MFVLMDIQFFHANGRQPVSLSWHSHIRTTLLFLLYRFGSTGQHAKQIQFNQGKAGLNRRAWIENISALLKNISAFQTFFCDKKSGPEPPPMDLPIMHTFLFAFQSC